MAHPIWLLLELLCSLCVLNKRLRLIPVRMQLFFLSSLLLVAGAFRGITGAVPSKAPWVSMSHASAGAGCVHAGVRHFRHPSLLPSNDAFTVRRMLGMGFLSPWRNPPIDGVVTTSVDPIVFSFHHRPPFSPAIHHDRGGGGGRHCGGQGAQPSCRRSRQSWMACSRLSSRLCFSKGSD